MHRERPRSLAVALLLALTVVSLFPALRGGADPTIIDNPDGTSDAVWDFATPPDYTRTDVSIAGGVASLRGQTTWWNRTTQADFSSPDSATNIDLARWPGNVTLASTSGGSILLTLQPGAAGEDSYLDKQSANSNYGASTTILLDGRNPDIYRPVLRFDLSSIPAGAVIDQATLSLYETAGIGNTFTSNVHRITAAWTESQVTWNDRQTGTAWGTAGGDYDAFVFGQIATDNTVGWKTANVTQLVDLWYRGSYPNEGLIIVPPSTGAQSDKTFASSDYAIDPSLRPTLDIRYRILGATGEYVSEVGGPGTPANWQTISWNATARSLATDEFSGSSLDGKWTWTNAPPSYDVGTTTPGSLHLVTATNVDLDGGTFTGHVLGNEVVGAFTATMKFTANPTANGQKAGLMVLLNARNWYAIQKAYVGATATVDWQAKSTADGVSTIRAGVNSGNPIPSWVRIERVGNAFTASTSPDGTSWTVRDTYTPTVEYPLQVRVAILAADGNSGAALPVDVDYVRVSLGPDATTTVQTRTGYTNPVDGTWSGWSAAYPTPSGSAMAGSSRYVQYRLTFSVTYPEHTPNVGDVNISWTNYVASGRIETNDLIPGDVAEWGNFTVVHTLNGQSIGYEYSLDSGGSWTPVVAPANLQGVSVATGKIRFRASLSTTNTIVTPTLSEMRISYRHQLDHFYVSTSGSAAAGAPFSVTVTAKDGANVTLTGWTGTVSLDARLTDGVTPGGGVLGATSLAITGGGTATLATETYTKAEAIRIRASFGAAQGLSGTVTIAPGPLDRIDVTPANITLLFLEDQVFTAQGFDAWDNPIPGLSFTWAATGGIGTLNTTTGASVTLAAGTVPANGTVEASSGPIVGSAQVTVTTGTRPWIAITAPASGDHITGIAPILYTNSTDAVSATFEYNAGAGWVLIGATAVLNGTYAWDTASVNFAGGSLRATVENNRTVTNTTVVSPLEVDNDPPPISLGAVTDSQTTSGTLTLTYVTAADVVRVDLTYYDGAWRAIGSDLTVDGTFVWTPSGPINGVTVRAIAVDEVGLTGAAQKQGVGSRTIGANPPAIRAIPEIRVRTGSAYGLNLTFYVSDADTPLASLAISSSDPANVTAAPGPNPVLGITYAASGTYDVTLWVSDGTDTAWAILRIIASGGNPPAVVAALPSVTFDEDAVARNALGSPLTAFFSDADGEPMTFAVYDGSLVSSVVNPNATLDLGAASNWSGSEVLRIRATDPTGAFAEAAFRATVLPVNDAPVLAAIPALSYDAGVVYVLDLQPYVSDVDNALAQLTVTTDSAYVSASGFLLTLAFPGEWERADFTITVSDGTAASVQAVSVTFIPPFWRSPYLLAIPPAGVLVVVAMFAQRARWRPTKAFLVDERGQLLREFTLDPSCTVTFDEAVKAGALDAVEKPIKVAKYNAQTVVGDALGVVLLAYGPVSLEQVEFARELLVNIQGKFEAKVSDRLEEARSYETRLEAAKRSLEESRTAFEAQTRAFAGVMDAVTVAQTKMAAEARSIREKVLDLEKREGRVREDRAAIDRLAEELGDLRADVDKRLTEVTQREEDADARTKAIRTREQRISPLEAALEKRETAVAKKETELSAKEEVLHAETTALETRGKALDAAEEEARRDRLGLDERAKDMDALQATLDRRTEEVQGREADAEHRLSDAIAREERVAPIEASLSTREKSLVEREGKVGAAEDAVTQREGEADRRLREAAEAEAAIEADRGSLKARGEELEGRMAAARAQFAELTERQSEAARLEEELEGRSGRIIAKESEIAEHEESLAPREAKLAEDVERLAQREAALQDSLGMLEADREALTKDGATFERDRKAFDARVKDFEARSAGFEAEMRQRTAELDERLQALQEGEKHLVEEQRIFEATRSERTQWIASKEIEIEAKDQSLREKEAAVRAQAEENARTLADLSSREEALEIGTDKLEKARAEFDARKADLDRLAKSLEAKAAQLRDEESRNAEEFRTWQATMESEQALLRDQREAFERDTGAQRDMWADRMLRVQIREQELTEKETKLREDIEWVARNDEDIKRRERALSDGTKDLETAKAQVEAARREIEARGMELDTRERSVREEAARHAEDLTRRSRALQDEGQALADERAAYERDASARAEKLQEDEAELSRTAQVLEKRAGELSAQETRLASVSQSLKEQEERLKREHLDLQAMAQQVAAKDEAVAHIRVRAEDEAERLRKEWEAFRHTVAEKEAEIASERERVSRDSNALQEKLGTKAQELAARERSIAAREAEMHAEEAELEARLRELETRERQSTAHATELDAQRTALAKRQKEIEERAAHLEATAKKLAADEAEKRREWEILEQTLKSHEAQIQADAEHRLSDVQRRMVDLERREQGIARTMAQLDVERAKLADAAKAQTANEADAAAAWSRAEERLAQAKGLEDELLRARQAFESERTSWSARRSEELKQLEATRDAAGEQSTQAERLIQETQRRANVAADAEKAAKRQTEELRALQAQVETRRAEAEAAQRALQEQTARLEEASRKLGAKEIEVNAKIQETQEREARIAKTAHDAAVSAEDTRARQAAIEKERVLLTRQKADQETRKADIESQRTAAEGKLAELSERERILMTELQRAENLMEDLGRKEGELKARERSLASTEEDIGARQAALDRKDAELREGMVSLERMRQDLESKIAAIDEDRKVAAASRDEAEGLKRESEQARAQADAMQKEVSKNMKFLQKKAVDVLDREEKLRARQSRIEEAEKTLEARAEVLDGKERSLDVDREELASKAQRFEGEVAKLRAQLAEAKGAAKTSEDMEEWRRDMEARVKIIQKKAFDLLDREEQLRKREEGLRTRAQELGIEL